MDKDGPHLLNSGPTCFRSEASTLIDIIALTTSRKIADDFEFNIGISDIHNVVGCAKIYV